MVLADEMARLRAENKFLKSFLQTASAKMDSQHHWRFTGDWRTAHLVGPDRDAAVANAMREQEFEVSRKRGEE